jgi:hypothetical protein
MFPQVLLVIVYRHTALLSSAAPSLTKNRYFNGSDDVPIEGELSSNRQKLTWSGMLAVEVETPPSVVEL